jgi:hypothetical protein
MIIATSRCPRTIDKSVLRHLLFGLCAALAMPGGGVLRAQQSFLVLPHTQSPDGRFAIGWGFPKHPEIWKRAGEVKQDEAESLIADVGEFEEDVENYVVDLRASRALATLRSHYWEAGELQPNRHQLEVVWSAASDLVLVNHTYRWDCRAFQAVRISDGKAGTPFDLKKALDAQLRQRFKKAMPRGAHFTADSLAISFSETAVISGETFKAHVDAEYPSKGDDAWSGEADIRFALTSAKNFAIGLNVLGLE